MALPLILLFYSGLGLRLGNSEKTLIIGVLGLWGHWWERYVLSICVAFHSVSITIGWIYVSRLFLFSCPQSSRSSDSDSESDPEVAEENKGKKKKKNKRRGKDKKVKSFSSLALRSNSLPRKDLMIVSTSAGGVSNSKQNTKKGTTSDQEQITPNQHILGVRSGLICSSEWQLVKTNKMLADWLIVLV